MIDGNTILIAHLGYPTKSFKAPMIYNPYFESIGFNAVVVPMGVRVDDYPACLRTLSRLTNLQGALVTMPHKVTTVGLVDEVSTAGQIAGACNAILLRPDGSLLGDMFDGEGFVRGMLRKGRAAAGASALVVGRGGGGCAIAASLAGAGVARLGLFDVNEASAQALADRLATHYPDLELAVGSKDPEGYEIVVNATPVGMNAVDPLPVDVARIDPSAFVGEVVMKDEFTPFLEAARALGCTVQVGTDMLFEQIPAYLEFFGFPSTTPDNLRAVARIRY
jgi:shikimate dehydrogenase